MIYTYKTIVFERELTLTTSQQANKYISKNNLGQLNTSFV